MLAQAVKKISEGLSVDGYQLYSKKVDRGRFDQEKNLGVYVKKDKEDFLLYIKVFKGIKPTYKEWVEFFSINNQIKEDDKTIGFYGSVLEDSLLKLFGDTLEPGGKLYVEYYEDQETVYGLNHGCPPPVTRLGYKLFLSGFTWFKDWYFPEGWSEGGQKLQGEKSLDDEAKKRHITDIKKALSLFIKGNQDTKDRYLKKALDRTERILNNY